MQPPQALRLTLIGMSDDRIFVLIHACLSPEKWTLAAIRHFAYFQFRACSLIQTGPLQTNVPNRAEIQNELTQAGDKSVGLEVSMSDIAI
jgi:hypothetical protein